MNYKVGTIPFFDKQLKRLVKKFPSLRLEYIALLDSLENDPKQGTPLGNNCYKIRLAVASKGKGKSGGTRVITYDIVDETTLVLLSIYDKSEQSSITDKELSQLLKDIK